MMNFTYNTQAQLAHIGWAGFVTLALWLVTAISPRSAALLVMAGSAIKEFIVDPLTESIQVQGSAWQDFGFLAIGAALAIVVIAVAMTMQHFSPHRHKERNEHFGSDCQRV